MTDSTRPGGLPAASSSAATAGSGGGVIAPNPIHLPPQSLVPLGPAPIEQARSFASSRTLSSVAGAISPPQTAFVSAAGKYVPLSYGPCRWSGYTVLWRIRPSTGALVLVQLLCEGPIGGVIGVEINNQVLRSGVSYTAYTGTMTQVADPTVVATMAEYGITYADAMLGLAYVVIVIPATAYATSELRGVDVEYLGKLVFDPRVGGQSASNPTTWAYNDNASLVFGDFLTSGQAIARNVLPRYGQRLSLDNASLTAAANFNDETIGAAPNTSRRSEVGFTLFKPMSNEQVEQMMRTHAMCFVDRLGDTVSLIPDVARAPVASYDETRILRFESITDREVTAAPTSMEVSYTNTSVKPWRRESFTLYDPRVLTGELPEIPGSVDLTACQSFRQAQAIALRRLLTGILSVRSWGIGLGAEGMKLQKADCIATTHPIGLTGKVWTVDTMTDTGFGQVYAKLSEYDAGVYGGVIQTQPQTLGSGASNCTTVPGMVGFALSQRSVNEPQSGGGYACILRVRAIWTATTFPCNDGYDVEVYNGASLVQSTTVGAPEFLSVPATIGVTYTVRARVRSRVPGQLPGAWSSANQLISAATCPPVPTQRVWCYGHNARRATFVSLDYVYWNEFTRTIRCDTNLTTITRTELWFGWGVAATFGSASRVRDDAGAQTQWTFWRGRKQSDPALADVATIALGLTADRVFGAGTTNALGSATAGTYANALTGYTGPNTEWFPPDKVWVRYNNGGVFSVPVELRVSDTRVTLPDTPPGGAFNYTFDGSAFVTAGSVLTSSYPTNRAVAYQTHYAQSGTHQYRYAGSSNHEIKSQAKDARGDLIDGYALFQYRG